MLFRIFLSKFNTVDAFYKHASAWCGQLGVDRSSSIQSNIDYQFSPDVEAGQNDTPQPGVPFDAAYGPQTPTVTQVPIWPINPAVMVGNALQPPPAPPVMHADNSFMPAVGHTTSMLQELCSDPTDYPQSVTQSVTCASRRAAPGFPGNMP